MRAFVVATVCFGCFIGFWVSWPHRTAVRFFDAVEAKDFDKARALLVDEKDFFNIAHILAHNDSESDIWLVPRNYADILHGKQDIMIRRHTNRYRLTAMRDGVVFVSCELFR